MSGGEPATSDARALSHEAVEQPVPAAARGQVYSPVAAFQPQVPFIAAPTDGEEASSRQAPAMDPSGAPSLLVASSFASPADTAAPGQPASMEQPAAPPSASPPAPVVRLKVVPTGGAAAPGAPAQPQQPADPVLPPADSFSPGQHGHATPGWLPPGAPWGHDAAAPAAQVQPELQAAHPPAQPSPQAGKPKFKIKIRLG